MGAATETGGSVAQALASRLAAHAPAARRPAANRFIETVCSLHVLMRDLKIGEADLRSLITFLTEVGHASDDRRQEWVLLADVLGFSALVRELNEIACPGVTPSTLPGPFFRPDAPLLEAGADICLDGRGAPLDVHGRVSDAAGKAVPGAMVEVWHANGEGFYENQEPDRQPEFNLRGKFLADAGGRFRFRSIKPKGYRLPQDGPVGHLLNALGYSMARPAHLGFRVTAPGFRPLITEFFDADDPGVGDDALFNVKPELLEKFTQRHKCGWSTEIEIVLAPAGMEAR